MTYKQNIKYFFSRFKRVIIAGVLCVAAIVLIGIVAYNANKEVSNYNQQNVQTSAPVSINFVMPIENGTIFKDYSNTTLKYNSTLKQWEAHKAVDIKGGDNAEVRAALDGEVVSIETTYLNGTTVTIKHSGSMQTVYASLAQEVKVQVGDKVRQGQVIGNASNTARNEANDGDHVHFEVLVDNVKVDPNIYLNSTNK